MTLSSVVDPPSPPLEERAVVCAGDDSIVIYQEWDVLSQDYVELEIYFTRPDGSTVKTPGSRSEMEMVKAHLHRHEAGRTLGLAVAGRGSRQPAAMGPADSPKAGVEPRGSARPKTISFGTCRLRLSW